MDMDRYSMEHNKLINLPFLVPRSSFLIPSSLSCHVGAVVSVQYLVVSSF